MIALYAFVSGLVFGLGLIVSGMANPAKVLGFLDLAGAWDPSLAFVIGGAVLVSAAGFAVLRRRRASLSGEPLRWPTATRIDARLALGSLAFGAGWGLAGFCPGPALVAASAGVPQALVFVAAMLAGMAIFSILEKIKSR
ncbi:membrane protein [Achromobacter sp. RTa]|uniref:YeeE/YedE family protein n=1 Tax=Achromobacter sp. RTa TaxID=1532557 RepID=UPI00050FC42E|nr:YeeE/YedE family protein [Achromobacter sp. RTa]KGE01670.1 membrane protein [Achromobacter sp. RTa]